MPTLTDTLTNDNFIVHESSLAPSARHYLLVTEDDDLHADAYVLDYDDVPRPNPHCVILFPCDRGWPGYLYAPELSIEGTSHEEAIRMAVAAYRAHHHDLITVLREAAPFPGDVGNAKIF